MPACRAHVPGRDCAHRCGGSLPLPPPHSHRQGFVLAAPKPAQILEHSREDRKKCILTGFFFEVQLCMDLISLQHLHAQSHGTDLVLRHLRRHQNTFPLIRDVFLIGASLPSLHGPGEATGRCLGGYQMPSVLGTLSWGWCKHKPSVRLN